MDGHVEVHIRIKPAGEKGIWSYKEDTLTYAQNGKARGFSCFNSVYFSEDTSAFYTAHIHPVISGFTKMQSATIMAYGQTGTGKTYTMSGEREDGLIFMALHDILPGRLTISYMEVYNERVYDLRTAKELKIAMSGQHIRIVGLHAETVTSEEGAKQFLRVCSANRRTNSTEYNLNSSRSHTIIQIRCGEAALNFIDLAGSEKVSSGDARRKEGAHINRSLLALSKVISGLAANRPTGYRESKLTRILQPSVNPHTSIVAICTISATRQCLAESLGTLNFAARLSNIDLRSTETVLPACGQKPTVPPLLTPGMPAEDAACAKDPSNKIDGERPAAQEAQMASYDDLALWDHGPAEGQTHFADKKVAPADGGSGSVDFYTEFQPEEPNCGAVLAIYEKRIESLEAMVRELLEKSPNKLMSEIFILERQMFSLRKQLMRKEMGHGLE